MRYRPGNSARRPAGDGQVGRSSGLMGRLVVGAVVVTAVLGLTSLARAGAASTASSDSGTKVSQSSKHLVATSVVSGTVVGDVSKLHPGWTKMTWGGSSALAAASGAKSAAVAKASTWSCSLYVGPVTLPNGVNGNLQAETDQVCSGAFGKQQTKADFARSSWTGYRLYASTSYSGQTVSTFLTTTFSVSCGGPKQGTYDYRLEAHGYAVPSGWTSTAASYGGSQKQRFACGT